ncbi:MAG TPA: dicarboxylate/amino acid:cation symporter [Polyangiaceae bacterium]|nr:dicarboxylate/amino acid:cation symporter [Polyangiaceae bacterium]
MQAADSAGPGAAPRKRGMPLSLRVLVGVVVGLALGVAFRDGPIAFGVRNDDLGRLGLAVVRLLKALAVPLVLFAIVEAFVKTDIRAKSGLRLVAVCLANVSVAFAIALTLMNALRPGERWRGQIEALAALVRPEGGPPKAPEGVTLDPLRNLAGYVPESLLEPFLKGNVIGVVLAGLLGGAALRAVGKRQRALGEAGDVAAVEAVERFVAGAYQVLLVMLEWAVGAVPFAVAGLIAQAVGKAGFAVFRPLAVFFGVVLLGFALHALVYYPALAWLVGRKPPRIYLGRGADAIWTGLSTNSSLATVPVTLRCLTRGMGVRPASARLAACVGTNLNNDGITLYEATTALFLAQATGVALGLREQATVVFASLMAGIGVAGIPEAGLVVLPLVLTAAGLPEATVAAAIPLIMPVDWVLARLRSGVNVMSDLVVAVVLDRFEGPGAGGGGGGPG